MNTLERNVRIYQIHKAHQAWTCQEIGELVGLTRQRVHKIITEVDKSGIISLEMNGTVKNYRLNGEPVSASQVAKETGIPQWTIEKWVQRGLVKVLSHPGHTAPGKPVLLDPVTLQARMEKYRPRRRKVAA